MNPSLASHVRTQRERVAGEAVLRPAAVVALCLLVLNDHVFKAHWPGVLTGKLSDFAGLVVCPVFLVTCFERVARRIASQRVVAAICIVTAVIFALTKTWGPATEAYRVVWAILRWPFAVIASVARHDEIAGIGRVAAVRDPTDLVALPAVAIAWVVCDRGVTRRGDQCGSM